MVTPRKTHTDREYENKLTEVRERLLLMAGRVEEMIRKSIEALLNGDAELARETIEQDEEVNRLEMETDNLCLQILARWQPMASDLRFVTLALKMVTDLERIGDLAVNICERAVDLSRTRQTTALPPGWREDVSRMAEIVQVMVRDAIDAFVKRDEAKARAVHARDDAVDELYDRVFESVLAQMMADSAHVHHGIHIQSVAKWLERVGDHATNLAEEVVFMIKGRDIRHVG